MMNFFFFNDTATTEIYTLSLHDALPILEDDAGAGRHDTRAETQEQALDEGDGDRKSTRLNSSHLVISYAVFCLKKKNHMRLPSKGKPLQKKRRRRFPRALICFMTCAKPD